MCGDHRNGSCTAHTLPLLESIMAADSLESAVDEVARRFGSSLDIVFAGFFVVLHGNVYLESWYPATEDPTGRLTAHLRERAVEAAASGADGTAPVPVSIAGVPLEAGVQVLPLKNRLAGVLCTVAAPHANAFPASLRAIVPAVALHLDARIELDTERKRANQLEHWFRVSERQVSTLDLERQKFAVLSGWIDSGVMVVDPSKTIQWVSRRLVEQWPAHAERQSWTGRPCQELCRHIGGHAGSCCQTCTAEQVIASGQAVRQAIRNGSTDGAAHLAGLPLRGPDGRPHQVMVMFPGTTIRAGEADRAA